MYKIYAKIKYKTGKIKKYDEIITFDSFRAEEHYFSLLHIFKILNMNISIIIKSDNPEIVSNANCKKVENKFIEFDSERKKIWNIIYTKKDIYYPPTKYQVRAVGSLIGPEHFICHLINKSHRTWQNYKAGYVIPYCIWRLLLQLAGLLKGLNSINNFSSIKDIEKWQKEKRMR